MFNPTSFQKEITQMIFKGEFDQVRTQLWNPDLSEYTGEAIRIERLRKLFNEVLDVVNKAETVSDEWQKVTLKDSVDLLEETITISRDIPDLFSLPSGKYQFSQYSRLRSWFDQDFHDSGEKFKRVLRHSRFHVPIETVDASRFRIATDVRVCTYAPQMYAYSFDGYYDRSESGRLSKACGVNFCHKVNSSIDAALLLPIPHLYGNYYHLISEMIYGLRFVKYLPEDTRIIVGPDKFGILETIASRLNIDKDRFISIEQAKDLLIKKAVIPAHPNYFWDMGVYDFFRSIFDFHDSNAGLKLYISRSSSTRSYANEKSIEELLTKRGFLILHNENLSFVQQAYLYSQADVIVSPHGAGETNILFAKNNCKLIELFSEEFLCRDFYLRSRHIGVDYNILVYDGELNTNDLVNKL